MDKKNRLSTDYDDEDMKKMDALAALIIWRL